MGRCYSCPFQVGDHNEVVTKFEPELMRSAVRRENVRSNVHTPPRSKQLEDKARYASAHHKEPPADLTEPGKQLMRRLYDFDRPQGIPNRGATCYMNSALQGLIATDNFVVQSVRLTCDGKELALSNGFMHFVTTYSGARPDTGTIGDALAKGDKVFTLGNQYDAGLTLSAIFSRMRQDFAPLVRAGKLDPIATCFAFESVCSTTCNTCTAIKWNTQDNLNMLHLSLDDPHSPSAADCPCLQPEAGRRNRKFKIYEKMELYTIPCKKATKYVTSVTSALEFTFRPCRVVGYQCRTCGHVGDVTQELFLLTLPRYLVICLKRYQIGPDTRKDSRPMVNEAEIDLGGFVMGKDGEYKEGTYKYQLYAALVHSGDLSGGHYFAYIKWNDRWHRADDSNVTEANYERNVKGACASLLLYERISRQ